MSKKRLTIGLVAPLLWSRPAGFPMLDGVADAAATQGINFICFQGNHVDNLNPKEPENLVYKMVNKEAVDGLIIWASSYAGRIGNDGAQAFCDQFRPLPMVSIGMPLQGIPGIVVDSYREMRDVMAHLVEIHGYCRIAFMRGPNGHYDSEERFRAYLDSLKQYQIPFDPDLISSHGYWNPNRVAEDIRLLLDERNAKFDALVAPSDILATETMKELQERGIKIPEDIAVIGFNDEPSSRMLMPPLTTVNVKIYERGRQAVETLLELMAGKDVPPKVIVPSEMVIRRSCGCISEALQKAPLHCDEFIMKESSRSFQTSAAPHLEGIRNLMIQSLNAPGMQEIQWIDQLLSSFNIEIGGQSPGKFVTTLENIIRQSGKKGNDINAWHLVIATLHQQTTPLLNPSQFIKAENLWYQATLTISEVQERFLLQRQLQEWEFNWDSLHFNQRLNTVFDLPELIEIIAQRLLQLGFISFYLSLYENPQAPTQKVRLILAYNRRRRIPLAGEGQIFALPELVPKELWDEEQCQSLIVIPLYFEENHLGFIVVERTLFVERIVYASLQIQLSSALWGTLLFQKQKQTEMVLAFQAQELTRSNTELQQFAYVASHDLQEPLRKITIFSERLQQILSGSIDAKASDYLQRMNRAARRMQIIISDLITYSRVTSKAHSFQRVALSQIAQEAQQDLEIAINNKHGQLTITELPTIEADPLQMRQLFQNLISNALKYSRAEVSPIVKVYAAIFDDRCRIFFEDNGIGIEERYYDKIFQVFERLHGLNEYEGSGIGLAICKKIVERHAGKIRIESTPGEGSRFIIELPLRQQRSVSK